MTFNFFKKEKRAVDPEPPIPYGGNAVQIAQLFNSYSALNLSTVFACVNLISSNIAKLPVKVMDMSNNDKNIVNNHIVTQLFGEVGNNNIMTSHDIVKYLIASMLLRGNGYAHITRDKNGKPTYIRYLESGDVVPVYQKEKDRIYYQCAFVNHGKPIPQEDMIHLKMWSYNGVEGVSVVGLMRRSISIANATENAANEFFENGCAASGILVPTTQTLQQKQIDQIKQGWSRNTSAIQVLNGPMNWIPMGVSAEDAEMLSSRKFEVSELCRWFLVPAILLSGEGGQTYSSLEMLQQAFLQNCLSTYIAVVEAEFNRKLLLPSERNHKIYFETNELLRTTKKDSSEYYSKLVQSGIITTNEARKELGYAGVEGGDDLRIAYSDANQNKLDQSDNNQQDNQAVDETD